MSASELIKSPQDHRLEQAKSWLQSLDIDLQSELFPIAGDASFRRYFRVTVAGQTCILMDAPPPGEDVRPFIDIAHRLITARLHAPQIFFADEKNGYLLLEDLGDELFRDLVDINSADKHFDPLLAVLKNLALDVNTNGLPEITAAPLQAEMDLFPDWYLGSHRKSVPREQFDEVWGDFCQLIIASALEQPRCFVHRDYHSSNLLQTTGGSATSTTVGIIDFQDAVTGPITYDFISLIWDRYITWPREQIELWMEEFRQMLGPDICATIDPQQWRRYCDLMGLQRNFKIVGIFARLHYRDGKDGYIEMLPRFYQYLTDTLSRHPEFAQMLKLLEQKTCVP